MESIEKLSRILGVPVAWFYDEKPGPPPSAQLSPGISEQLRSPTPSPLRPVSGQPMARIPVVGRVSAGVGSSNVDPDESGLYVPMSLAQIGGVGWVVEGDSMMPALEPGDVAIFREHRSPKRGYTFLLERDGEYRVKIIDYDQVAGSWKLRSLNPAFGSEEIAGHTLLGYLIGWYKVRGSFEATASDPGGLKLEP